MKRKVVYSLIAAMMLSMSVPAYAAPSIGESSAIENATIISGNTSGGETLITQKPDTTKISNAKAAEAVEKVNNSTTVVKPSETAKSLGVDTSKKVELENTNKKTNVSVYEYLTDFEEVALKKEDKLSYETNGELKVSLTYEAAKDKKKEDLVLAQINPETGKISFVAVEDLNSKTGEVTTTLTSLGEVALMEALPVVTKTVSTELYKNDKVKETIDEIKDQVSGVQMSAVLGSLDGQTVTGEVQIAEGVTVDPEKCVSMMKPTDLAIKTTKEGQVNYSFDMEGELPAKAHRNMDDVDWQDIVKDMDADFDVAAAEEDPSLLTTLKPFKAVGYFVMQIDPETGEKYYIDEPVLSFAYPEDSTIVADEEDTAENTDAEDTESADTSSDAESTTEASDTEDSVKWNVKDEDNKDDVKPNLVIEGSFKCMGPFILFKK